jgi:hypothetical protein
MTRRLSTSTAAIILLALAGCAAPLKPAALATAPPAPLRLRLQSAPVRHRQAGGTEAEKVTTAPTSISISTGM